MTQKNFEACCLSDGEGGTNYSRSIAQNSLRLCVIRKKGFFNLEDHAVERVKAIAHEALKFSKPTRLRATVQTDTQ
jgi:hypothetical protein